MATVRVAGRAGSSALQHVDKEGKQCSRKRKAQTAGAKEKNVPTFQPASMASDPFVSFETTSTSSCQYHDDFGFSILVVRVLLILFDYDKKKKKYFYDGNMVDYDVLIIDSTTAGFEDDWMSTRRIQPICESMNYYIDDVELCLHSLPCYASINFHVATNVINQNSLSKDTYVGMVHHICQYILSDFQYVMHV
ncbi:unnamed protein product [Triticum turgidum subsp. durum]|uniref:Uncharacterized protein n=2 Tax=Triticum TaxID=4564 RepID=A0A9R1P2S2_TRITD|nr:unnamed protein product [Triticum turgidum subsp. durum]